MPDLDPDAIEARARECEAPCAKRGQFDAGCRCDEVVERLRGNALAVLRDADLTYSLVTETADGPVPGPMRTDADAIARALGIDRITGGAVAASVADEYRAHRDRERERRIHWEKQTIRAEAERDEARAEVAALASVADMCCGCPEPCQTSPDRSSLRAERDDLLRRYEALRDGVTGLCDRYEHAEQWANPPSGQTVAAKFHGLVARVEGGES